MNTYLPFTIKSFKHDGHLHRMWYENWLLSSDCIHPKHAQEQMQILINSQTRIQEANGKEWTSKIPGISFFLPNQWYNIVALIEASGIRYYCNVASPFYKQGNIITYIDYDLDVIVTSNREYYIVDKDEYETHKNRYHYSDMVDRKVKEGLSALLERIEAGQAPFQDDIVHNYLQAWQLNRQ